MTFDDTQPVTGRPGDEYSSAAYRDYSTYLQNGGELITHKKSDRNFPTKLHRIVSDPLNSLVITWMLYKAAYRVGFQTVQARARYVASRGVRPFAINRVCSRLKRPNSPNLAADQGCYYHEAFLRGLPELTCFIRRMPRHCRKSDRKKIEPEEEPEPPSHSSPTRGESSSAHRKLDLNEQAGQRDDDKKFRHVEDGILEDEFSSVPPGSSPSHCCNHGEYPSTEYLRHDQHNEASAPLESQSWGGMRPSGHYCYREHWSSPCLGKERPPHPGASTSENQYKATPQYFRPQEQSHSSPRHHSYDYGHCNYGYCTPPGYQCHYDTQADTYNHYNNPHYHQSHQPYYQLPHYYYHPPPAYPLHNGGQWHSPKQTHNHGVYHNHQTSPTGWTLEEEASQDRQSRKIISKESISTIQVGTNPRIAAVCADDFGSFVRHWGDLGDFVLESWLAQKAGHTITGSSQPRHKQLSAFWWPLEASNGTGWRLAMAQHDNHNVADTIFWQWFLLAPVTIAIGAKNEASVGCCFCPTIS
ncbi:hypothetical protein THAOC_32975 [Thalassiosira oceanica]|uniref:HSF-type DNA-binding domain-containing protein n=1 Tax=Thalassiosira oceanica TaxID=159749 RepID=K0R4X8_THAOC|nr:hypothetical protein THAOC_32975 [Thalassiosira oceanica]|eukprot:EJK48243.1 hypothetical protein THAOC_32975 [Thalassiosira oceanica]